jgi:hypothetical protein
MNQPARSAEVEAYRLLMADRMGAAAEAAWAAWDREADPIDQGRALAFEHAELMLRSDGGMPVGEAKT